MVLGKLDSHMQKNETYIIFKNQLKMVTVLNIRPETIRLPEENRKFLDVLMTGNDFLNLTLKAKAISNIENI